jgi:hypothetical protein
MYTLKSNWGTPDNKGRWEEGEKSQKGSLDRLSNSLIINESYDMSWVTSLDPRTSVEIPETS